MKSQEWPILAGIIKLIDDGGHNNISDTMDSQLKLMAEKSQFFEFGVPTMSFSTN